MTAALLKRPLQLTLHPQDVLPEAMSWRLREGYVRAMTWDFEGESITLGLWGPAMSSPLRTLASARSSFSASPPSWSNTSSSMPTGTVRSCAASARCWPSC